MALVKQRYFSVGPAKDLLSLVYQTTGTLEEANTIKLASMVVELGMARRNHFGCVSDTSQAETPFSGYYIDVLVQTEAVATEKTYSQRLRNIQMISRSRKHCVRDLTYTVGAMKYRGLFRNLDMLLLSAI